MGVLMMLPDRVLEPVERISEILFGLIMALTITGAVSVTTADRLQIRTMLIAALGCNLAWGIIDAGMYLMARLGERGRMALVTQAVRETTDRENAHRLIANELPLADIFRESELELIREKINQLPHSATGPRLSGRDWLGALGVFVLVVVSTFPVVNSISFHRGRQMGAAHVQRTRSRNAVSVRGLFRTLYGASAVGHRPGYGDHWCRTGGHCDSARWLNSPSPGGKRGHRGLRPAGPVRR